MKSTITPISGDALADYARIAVNTYPHPQSEGFTEDHINRKSTYYQKKLDANYSSGIYGLYRNGSLRGAMSCYDFKMNLHGRKTLCGGVGGVAVDILHKKKGIAKELLQFFHQHYYDKGAALVSLYAFRLDFYQKMGYALSHTTRYYQILPTAFPKTLLPDNLRFLYPNNEADKVAFQKGYQALSDQYHGLYEYFDMEIERILENTDYRILAYFEGKDMKGYMAFNFQFEKGIHGYTLNVRELLYDRNDRTVLQQFLTYLHLQLDQVKRVELQTEDEHLRHLLSNPHNGEYSKVILHHPVCREESGLMHRIIHLKRYFEEMQHYNFNGVNLRLCIDLEDDFFVPNNGPSRIDFRNGRAAVVDSISPADVTIQLHVRDFSAMAVGAIGFRQLYQYSLAQISDLTFLDVVDHAFRFPAKPICVSRF